MRKVLGADLGLQGDWTRTWTAFVVLAVAISLAGCHKKAPGVGEAAAGQKTFSSANEAGKALADAAKNDNQTELLAIFGPGSKDIIDSGDAVADKASLTGFAAAYDQMNRWRQRDSANQLLLVGATNIAFPVPLRLDGDGKWYFDTAAGKDELIVRRIGRNEMAAIDTLAALADAQAEYFTQAHDGAKQYARKFISDPGKENGLYWPQAPGKPKSPLGPLVAFATAEGYRIEPNKHQPFHGYYFASMDKQGPSAVGGMKDYIRTEVMNRGFAFVAYPAEYGKSGIMTFIVDIDRVVYQKDIGPTTGNVASVMAQYNPDGSWSEVKQ